MYAVTCICKEGQWTHFSPTLEFRKTLKIPLYDVKIVFFGLKFGEYSNVGQLFNFF
jgi:hypothetical protein